MSLAACGLRCCKNRRIDPLCFLAGCRKRQLNQVLSVSHSIGLWVKGIIISLAYRADKKRKFKVKICNALLNDTRSQFYFG